MQLRGFVRVLVAAAVFITPLMVSTAVLRAQNAGGEQPASQPPKPKLPALPRPREAVSTEKPIEGGLPIGDDKAQPALQETAKPSQTGQQPAGGQATSAKAPGQSPAGPSKLGTHLMEERDIFNAPTSNLRTVKVVIDNEYNLRGMVWGDERTYLHVLEADANGNFKEIWKSPSLNGEIRGVFVDDLENDGQTEIIAYTAKGDFFIYGYESRTVKYKTPDGTYADILCMTVCNMDNSPEKELLYIAVRPGNVPPAGQQASGNLIQFDPVSQFEEWTSQQRYAATDMVIGNVDSDAEPEIVLNTGEILDMRFKDIKWKSDVAFGSRLYLIDMDNDGLLEVMTEYNQSYIRVIDVDQRREKW
jgi:hypothetical protein